MAKKSRKSRYSKSNSKEINSEDIVSKLDKIRDKNKQQTVSVKTSQHLNTQIMVGAIIGIIAISALGGLLFLGNGSNILNAGNGTGGPNVNWETTCINHSNLGVHDHFNIEIYINSEYKPFPANVGVLGDCMRPMHTHDPGSYIHIEIPQGTSGRPTIGDFFKIYKLTNSDASLTNTELMGVQGNITAMINSNPSTSITNFLQYNPQDGDDIYLSVKS